MLLAKTTNDLYKSELAQAKQPDPSVFYASTDNIIGNHKLNTRLDAVLFKLVYFARKKNKQPLDVHDGASIACAMSDQNIVEAIDSIDDITAVKVARIGGDKIVLDDPLAIDRIVKIWNQRAGRERRNIIDGSSRILIL